MLLEMIIIILETIYLWFTFITMLVHDCNKRKIETLLLNWKPMNLKDFVLK